MKFVYQKENGKVSVGDVVEDMKGGFLIHRKVTEILEDGGMKLGNPYHPTRGGVKMNRHERRSRIVQMKKEAKQIRGRIRSGVDSSSSEKKVDDGSEEGAKDPEVNGTTT